MSRTGNIITNLIAVGIVALSLIVVATVITNADTAPQDVPVWMMYSFVPAIIGGGLSGIWLWVMATPKRG